MSKRFMWIGAASVLFVSIVVLSLTKLSNTDREQKKPFSKQYRIDLAIAQEVALTRNPYTGEVPREKLLAAKGLRDELASRAASRTSRAVDGVNWVERGPSNIGGRTRALLFDLNDAGNGYKKVWAGSVSGGLWYTSNITAAAPAWVKVDDFMENLAISAIVQNPLNPQEMYIGTGEGWFNSDAVKGLGIWKSADAGATWTRLPSTQTFAFVNDLLIDKNGHLYASVRQQTAADARGIHKSTNGGATWTEVLSNTLSGSSARGADLELGASGDIYASLGTAGSNGGIYISDFAVNGAATGNAGTWTNITPDASGTIAAPSGLWQRIELATAPSDAKIVYALFQGSGSNDCTSIQQYDRSTNTWSVKMVPTIIDQGSNSPFTRGQAWYDLIAAVDPLNAASLYIGGVDALRSDNGGETWTQMTSWSLFAATGFTAAQNVHADHHAIVYAPGSASRALWGTDGGVHYTETANTPATTKPVFASKNTGYNVTQYYACAVHPTLSNYFLAGAQDNGTQKFTGAGINATTTVTGGDGAYCHIDQDNPSIQISSFVYNNYFISTNGGVSFTSRSFNNAGGFINPTDYDNSGNVLYGANAAGTFFRWNDPATPGSAGANVSCAAFGGATVTHVMVSPAKANSVFFGLSNGSIVRVDEAQTGTSVTGTVVKAAVANTSVSGIAIDGVQPDHMVVTYSNYGVVSVMETQNAAAPAPVWQSVEGSLPDMPVRWVMFDPRNSDWALIATELGVWSTDNLNGAATDWQPTNGGLANVRVDMLQLRPSDNTIVATTHGRGLFTAVIASGPPPPTPFIDFAVTSAAVTEQTAASTTCRKFRDYVVAVTTSAPLVGDANITFSVLPSGTARAGVDYDITTNTDFIAPSLTQTFISGSAVSKNLTIRIYNDAEIEATESFTIQLALSGNTNAVLRNSSYTVTITDNDAAPTATTAIATTLNAGNTEYLAGSNDLYYYTTAGELLARVSNLSGQNFGCTQVVIDRAGTGGLPLWNGAPSTYLASKTYRVIPATNAAGAKYRVTLYYTEAEKVGWERTTGKVWKDIKIVKAPGSISEMLVGNADAAQVIEPAHTMLGTRYALIFETEAQFTGFGAGIPGTPNDKPVVFPNPFKNEIRIRFPQVTTGPVTVSLYDMKGNLIRRIQHPGSSNSSIAIDVRSLDLLSGAIYTLEVFADRKRHSVKVLKQ